MILGVIARALLCQQRSIAAIADWVQHQQPLLLAAWPAPGGLLPLGTTDNGDQRYWLTAGAPQAWPLVVLPRSVWIRKLG
jgi:hypothetical protein